MYNDFVPAVVRAQVSAQNLWLEAPPPQRIHRCGIKNFRAGAVLDGERSD
jgi:hypothetical protein